MNRSRTKGHEGQREVAAVLARAGLGVQALRDTANNGSVGQLDMLAFGPHSRLAVECKRAERWKMGEWMLQLVNGSPTGFVPVLALRRNHGDWWALVPLADLARMAARHNG